MSRRNTYGLSNGDRITQQQLDAKIAKAKKQIVQERDPVCSGSGVTGVILDCDHTLSVQKCKNLGKADLAYDPDNIVLSSRECHRIWEGGSIQERMKLLNFDDRMQYLKKHCAERFIGLLIAVGSVDREKYFQLLHPYESIEQYLQDVD